MVIIAGHCLDCAITADLIDPGRVNIFERWESQAALEAFRGGGPSPGEEQAAAMLSTSVAEYDVVAERPVFEKDTVRIDKVTTNQTRKEPRP